MKSHSLLILGLGAACLVVGFTSYRMGRDRAMAASVSHDRPAGKGSQASDPNAEATLPRSSEELVSLKEQLKHRYAACPSADYDWILRSQTAVVLATMTTAELESLLREILPSTTDRNAPPVERWQIALASDLLRVWSRKDPVAACLATDLPHVSAGRFAAFGDWLLRDPPAVARWMNSTDKVPVDLRKAWLSERVKTDPHDAIQQLAGRPPEEREASLLEWSTSFALLPAERMALLEVVREEPALMRHCVGRMAAALADRSVEETYAFVDSLKLDEEMTASLDDGIFAKWATREPQVAFAAWAGQKETRVPDSFLSALDAWSMNSPGTEEAIRWVGTVEAGPAKEKIQVHFIEDLTESERFEQAVRMGMSLDNREEGKRQIIRVVTTWNEKFPGHARERLAAILREDSVDVR